MPFAVTNEVKKIMFQHKVIHNVLPTRVTLYRDGLSENPICNLCSVEQQTLHLLINCTLTVDFWTLFQNWWYQKTNETIKLSATHVLYVWHDRTKHWQALIAKYCIFCTSVHGDVLDFQWFLLLLYGNLEILKEDTKIFSHLGYFTLINFNCWLALARQHTILVILLSWVYAVRSQILDVKFSACGLTILFVFMSYDYANYRLSLDCGK